MPEKKKASFKMLFRVLKLVFKFYPVLFPVTIVCILINAAVSAIPSVFSQNVISLVSQYWDKGAEGWETIGSEIIRLVIILAVFYIISLIAGILFKQFMAVITQGTLKKLRCGMFNGMQDLPVRYFDTHGHGDIMSYYTNDIDTLREMISQSFPQILSSLAILATVFIVMIYYSFDLAVVVIGGLAVMFTITKKIGGNSAKYFLRQQKAVAKTESYVEEMMNGQKVVKVFNHERISEKEFDKINNQLFEEANNAHRNANILGPILNNVGNLLYVIIAVVGCTLLALKAPNISISGLPFSISIIVPFLNMTKQFAGNINQVSMQANSIVMSMAGCERIFSLIDEKPEEDNGYVTLVNSETDKDGNITESEKSTGHWAWKHPHSEQGTVTYTPLEGDVRMFDVDFGYIPEKTVLHDISLYAKPGQKVAFVGATGAGKTTITNLLNRFYDIADGKIRYDGININKIKKKDLRRSLGMVLQDVHLFTGTVMDNIRYGKLDATEEECIEAAKLAGADDFISRMPDGYNTVLYNDASNLSQGQRQLISIARAAVADPPVLIMDEATSSIDTRTEAIVQRGMDALMKGRTVFVIAHRLSTVKNADVIIVLDHGKIIERGNHEQLITEKGQYYQLYTGAFELE